MDNCSEGRWTGLSCFLLCERVRLKFSRTLISKASTPLLAPKGVWVLLFALFMLLLFPKVDVLVLVLWFLRLKVRSCFLLLGFP